MASSPDSVSMALFCDFENVALGVRDAKYDKFDIMPVLERLLLKGSIVVKKAYCDWDRYKGFKAAMHEASFELIEIPHVRQSGKNSADIRLVVDALDLCYTKSHVDTFVIISGDSDFSPLVSKLRENAKKVIGVGVKNSTSDLLVANCDEFIFYDDLVREQQRSIAKREAREAREARDAREANATASSAKRSPEDGQPKQELEARKAKAIAIAVETFDDLASERGESGKIWASVLKSAIKRRKPDFNESYYGFRAFGNLLEEAQVRGLLEVGRDEKSGSFVFRTQSVAVTESVRDVEAPVAPKENRQTGNAGNSGNDRNRRKGRNPRQQVSEPLFDEPRDAQSATPPEAHSESVGERDRRDGPHSRSQVAEPLFDEPQPAQQPEAQLEARPRQGRDRNRRNNRNPRPQVHEPLFDVAQELPSETHAEAHVETYAEAADERPFFTLPPKAKEEFVFLERTEETPAQSSETSSSEVSETPSPKRGVARRGRQAAAKKVVAKTQPEAPVETASAADTVDSTDEPGAKKTAAKKTAAKRTPRKTAPASRRPRKTAAATSEE
ncbi:NYN domain protein [Caballeronia sp. SBC1]|uniref:NYN domain-containing protein n=1 Tax=Caballeronia sp. SBC1 TaxID=2705548 RepID=UPI00140BF969|nr:NYN domain-containing protein [Caballeronia sp. SBC1]QIN60808.1 NYN domain protein [Caballeronia sp. SBC1]